MKKLVIFDIDGTLLDSVYFNVKSLNSSLEALNFKYRVTESKVRKYLGCTGEEFYQGILDEETRGHWEQIRIHNRENNGELMLKYGRGFDGVKETFEQLKQKGYHIALYSNCSRVYMDRAIKILNIKEFIDYHECVKDNHIPKPRLVKKIIKKLGVSDAVVVGDRIHDYEAAKENGIECVGAMYGFGNREMESCRYKISHINELLQILEE